MFARSIRINKAFNMNWTIIIILGIAAVALIYFLIRKNVKDEIEFEDQLNNDYEKPTHKADENDIESALK